MEKIKRRTKEKRNHRIYALTVIILGIAILVMGFIVLFHIQKIEIKGTEYSTKTEVAQWLQDGRFTSNSLYVYLQNKLGHKEPLGFMEEAKVSMKNPWTIKVTVKEKEMVGCFVGKEEYTYIDSQGMVIKQDTVSRQEIPVVEGLEIEEPVLYETIQAKDDWKKDSVLEALKYAKDHKVSPERVVSDNDGVTMVFGRVYVNLGIGNLENKILQIPPILEKLSGQEGTLHLEYFSDESTKISFKKGEIPENDEQN